MKLLEKYTEMEDLLINLKNRTRFNELFGTQDELLEIVHRETGYEP